jgi:hypothetical protein
MGSQGIWLPVGELADHQPVACFPTLGMVFAVECCHTPWHHRRFHRQRDANRLEALTDPRRGRRSQELWGIAS